MADSSDAKLYAYFLSNQEWLSNPGHGFDTLRAAGNTNPSGIWSDGVIMWVADRSDAKLYAYDLGTKMRRSSLDFDTLGAAGNTNPSGIWSDGVTMWVADSATNRIYSYNMPPQSALGPLTVPGAPGNLRAIARDDTSIALSWSPPLNDGGAAITGYRIEVSQDGSNWRNYVAYTGDTSTNDGHNALTPGSTYFYRVSAINAIGAGPASNIATATTAGTALTSPCATDGAVEDPADNTGLVADCETLLVAKVVLAGSSGYNVNWSASTPIRSWQGVRVWGTPPRVSSVNLSLKAANGTIPAELGSLSALESLWLRENNLTGGIPAELSNLTNLRELKLDGNELSGRIPRELGLLTNLEILWLPNNELSGGIPPELGLLTNLRVLFLFRNNLSGGIPPELGDLAGLTHLSLFENQLSGDVPQELSGLTSLISLLIYGNSLTGCVPGNLEAQLDTTTTRLGNLDFCASAIVPGAPTGLTATANGQTRIDLSWTAPSDDGGANITGYRIEVSSDGSSWTDLVTNTGNTTRSYSHTGLTAGTTRHYRVSAINSVGMGQPSGIATGTTAAAVVPSAPVISGVDGGADALTVSWSAPPSDGGSSITAYDLRHIRSDATNKGDANWTVVQDAWTGSGARSYELADLDGGTQYDVQVRAVNADGDGSWSVTATGISTAEQSAPGSPANAQHVRVGSTTVVSWDQSTGATHYKLYHSNSRFPRCSLFLSGSTSGCDELAANVAATTYGHTSPDANTNSYWITACNAAGCSEIDSGNPAHFVDNRPAAPTGAQYVRVGSTAVVTWDQSTGATHYKVYYDDFFGTSCRLSSGSPRFCELLAGNVTGTTYTHASPDKDSNYYWVVGCNSAGCSDIDGGNPATLVETTRSATAPAAPTRLTATGNGQIADRPVVDCAIG